MLYFSMLKSSNYFFDYHDKKSCQGNMLFFHRLRDPRSPFRRIRKAIKSEVLQENRLIRIRLLFGTYKNAKNWFRSYMLNKFFLTNPYLPYLIYLYFSIIRIFNNLYLNMN